jgi:uncharacterized protein
MTRRLSHLLGDPNRKRRILALDGGGVRGLLTLGVLAQLEGELSRRSGDPDYRLSQYFDLIGGTSTGSIIAASLAFGWRVERITREYERIIPKLFRRKIGAGIFEPAYDERPLEVALRVFFQDETLDSDDLETGFAIFTKQARSGRPWALSNHAAWNYYDRVRPNKDYDPNSTIPLRTLVQASAAAPHFFPSVRLAQRRGRELIDGGVAGYNNPALELLMMVRDPEYGFNWPLGPDSLFLLSIGTGWAPERAQRRSIFFSRTISALRGVIADVSLQQIAVMQAIGCSAMPWYINSEKEVQGGITFLAPAPLLTYQRVDVRFESQKSFQGDLLPDTAEALLGRKLSTSEFKGLQNIANHSKHNSALLTSLGKKAGTRFIQNASPPGVFDHPQGQWTRTGSEGPGTRRG